MPIRINLLAEQQAGEELRRKDPVKRSGWIAGFLVSLVLLLSLYYQMKIWMASEDLKGVLASLKSLETKSSLVMTNQVRTAEMDKKLRALHQMSTNRFLCASLLNAVEYAIPDQVHILRLRTKQDYDEMPMIPLKKEGDKVLQPFKPATTVEKARIFIEGTITGSAQDDSIEKLKNGLRKDGYLKSSFANDNSLRLNNRAPMPDLNDPGKTILNFTLEGIFPEKTR
jgi:hypothetical protein